MTRLSSRLLGPATGALTVGTVGPLVSPSGLTPAGQAAVLLAAFVGGWLAVTANGGVLGRIGDHPAVPMLAFVPLVTALGIETAVQVGVVSQVEVSGFIGVGVAGGAIVVTESRERGRENATGAQSPHVTWRARPAPGRRRQRVTVAVALLVVPAAYVLAWLARLEVPTPSLALFVATIGLAAAFSVFSLSGLLPAEHELYDTGLLLAPSSAFLGRFLPADRLEGYSLTEDTLVVRRSGWLPDVRFDRRTIDDPEAVIEALESTGLREI